MKTSTQAAATFETTVPSRTRNISVVPYLLAVCLLGVASSATAGYIAACPFCSAVSQTLRQEMQQMDAVAIATFVESDVEASIAVFEIESILKGENLVQPKQRVRINYFGQPAGGQKFLVMGIDPPDLLWSSPLQLSDKAIDYIHKVAQLPTDDSLARLKFYLQYMEDEDPILARDVYDEFASASYTDMTKLKDRYDREWLIEEIKNTELSPDRRRLYLVMLGICGKPEDAAVLETMLRSDDPNQRFGLDALIACFLGLRGADGLKVVDELYLTNRESTYADTYAAIMALRFHGTDGQSIERPKVANSLKLMLDRAELADLVIPDLARWEDWTVIDRLAELFKTADEKSSWVRVPVINYLRACPKPEAAKVLEELKEIDPVSFRRATQFFPVPQPANQESSSKPAPRLYRSLVSDRPSPPPVGVSLASSAPIVGAVFGGSPTSESVNPILPTSVLLTTCTTIWLAMWLAMTGAGRYPTWVNRLIDDRN